MTNRLDLLLILAGALFIAGCALIAVELGFLAAALVAGACWYLLGDA